jgi:hypothetical protein
LFPGITLLDPKLFDRAAKRRVNKPRRPVSFAGHLSGLMLKVSLWQMTGKSKIADAAGKNEGKNRRHRRSKLSMLKFRLAQ